MALDPGTSAELIKAADTMSDLANGVAAFAIAQVIVLMWAALRDLAVWVRKRFYWFEGGVVAGGALYCVAIWRLHAEEMHVRSLGAGQWPDGLTGAYAYLEHARMAAVIFFTLLAMGALFGARFGPEGSRPAALNDCPLPE